MKKTLVSSLLMSSILASTMVGGASVFAAPAPADTDAKITVKEAGGNTTPPEIVDPTDPGDGTGQTGPFTLSEAAHLDFGEVKIDGKNIDKAVEVGTDSMNQPYHKGIQVNDLRGTGEGWHVNMALSAFKGTQNTAHELKGATIEIPAGTVKTDPAVTVDPATMPDAKAATLTADGSDFTVMNAEVDKGMGSWYDDWDVSQIRLKAPSGQYADDYSATLTYTLTSAPI